MRAYITVAEAMYREYFIYRFNFILWRIRNFISFLVKYYIWIAAYGSTGDTSTLTLFGYSLSEMLTYLFLSEVIRNFIMASRTNDVAGQIIDGKLIDIILKPLNFFTYTAVRDLVDKSINVTLNLVEIAILFVLLKPTLIFQPDPFVYVQMFVFLCIALSISFYLSLIVSFIGFYTPEVWAPRFIYGIIVYLLSGNYFPLDIIPQKLYFALFLTPFPYIYFLPSRAYLGIEPSHVPFMMIGGLSWVVLSYVITKAMWLKGIKDYSYYGR